MPLQDTSIEFPFRVGQDSSEDSEGSPKPLVVQNFEYDKDGGLQKRKGFREVASEADASHGTLLPAGDRIGVLTSAGVRLFSPEKGFYTQDSTDPSLQTPAVTHTDLLTRYQSDYTTSVDSASLTLAGVDYVALSITHSRDFTGGTTTSVQRLIINMTTGAVIYDVAATGDQGKVAAWNRVTNPCFAFTHKSGTTVFFDKLVKADSSAFYTTPVNVTGVEGDYALAATAANMVVAYGRSSDGFVGLTTFTPALVATSATDNTLSPDVAAAVALCVCGIYVVIGVDHSATARVRAYDPTTLVAAAAATSVLTSPREIGVVSTGATTVLIVAGTAAGTITYNTVDVITGALGDLSETIWPNMSLATTPYVSDLSVVVFGVRLVHTTVALGTGGLRVTFPAVLMCALQPTGSSGIYRLRAIGQVAFDEVGVPPATAVAVPHVAGVTGGKIVVPTVTGFASDTAGTYLSRVRAALVDLSPVGTQPYAALNGAAYVAGSMPRAFDGEYLTQAAWLADPRAPTAALSGTGLTGAYSYVFVLEWANARGDVQLSPPSVPLAVTPTNKTVTLTVHWDEPTTLRGAGTAPVRGRIYRTEASGSTYYLVASFPLTGPGDTFGTATFADNVTDATIRAQQTLYTTGGALESGPAPPLAHVWSFRNRLVGIVADRPVVAFTQELSEGCAPRWCSPTLTFRVDDERGAPIAGASLGDKMVVFKEHSTYVVGGIGPDGLGDGGFTLPERVSSHVGVAPGYATSVVSGPFGVMFRHASGIQLLTQAKLEVMPIGGPVRTEVLASTKCVGRHMPHREEVWYLTDSYILVYNYRFGRWYRWTPPTSGLPVSIEDAVGVGSTSYLLCRYATAPTPTVYTHARLFTLSPTLSSDLVDGSVYFVPAYIDLPWTRASGHGGMQRLRKVHVHGRNRGYGILKVEVFVQKTRTIASDAAAVNTYTATATQRVNVANVVADVPFTVSARVGSAQMGEGHRCRISFAVEPATATPGEVEESAVAVLHSVRYDVGITQATGKNPAANRPTSS